MLQTNDCYKDKDVILTTLLWYNNSFQLQLNRQWLVKGIIVVGDLLDEHHNIQPLEFINNYYNINMNFLEYHSLKLNEFLEF